MKIVIQTPGFKADQALLNSVNKKLMKLDSISNKVLEADVCLKIDKSDTKENKTCEIKLLVPGNDLFAAKQSQTFEESVDKVIDALKRQLVDRKPEHH
jgi:putative sigma-54 modulation protein